VLGQWFIHLIHGRRIAALRLNLLKLTPFIAGVTMTMP
jgi:hypothetical protein